jgi:hypothetical protein
MENPAAAARPPFAPSVLTSAAIATINQGLGSGRRDPETRRKDMRMRTAMQAAAAAATAAAAFFLLARCQPQVTGEQYRELQLRIYKLEVGTQALKKRVEKLEKKAAASDKPAAPSHALPKPTGKAKDVRCQEKDGGYFLAPGDAALLKEDMGSLFASFRFLPFMKDGVMGGFKLYGIRADSFGGSCGLMNGDVLLKINDRDLLTAEDLLIALEASMQEEDEIRFQVMRHSQLVEISSSTAAGGAAGG